MNVAVFWEQGKSALGLDEPGAVQIDRGLVNGNYILIDRALRIGHRVLIGQAKDRVEEVGIRFTALRPAAGERIIVTNTGVFSRIIENLSEGTTIEVTVEHDLGHHFDDRAIDRLRTLFGEATIATKTPAAAS